MDFDDLVGKTVDFYGVDCNCFCVQTEGGERVAFEALEDESDGYRSYLGELKVIPFEGKIFFEQPIAKVIVQEAADIAGFRLVDATTEHPWLRVGTDSYDDYYPCFVFDYDPPRTGN